MQKQSKVPTKKLNNGLEIPVMGFGTFGFQENELVDVIKTAILEHGYRRIDTAAEYKNEELVGKALQECFAQGIKREEIFVSTKLWRSDRGRVEDALRDSLQKLKLDYVDLYLIHWMLPEIKSKDPL